MPLLVAFIPSAQLDAEYEAACELYDWPVLTMVLRAHWLEGNYSC